MGADRLKAAPSIQVRRVKSVLSKNVLRLVFAKCCFDTRGVLK